MPAPCDLSAAASARPSAGNPRILAALLVLLVGLIQFRFMTAGWTGWPQYTDDYRRLSDGFLHGQLSLPTRPAPALLALSDPYDAALNKGLRLHDAILFNGKYYLYWGPVPALLAAALCLPLGIAHPRFGDQTLVFTFIGATALLATILVFRIHARFFKQCPIWPAAAAVLSLGAGTPMLFTLARPAIYEAAIAAGQCFLLAAILLAWQALRVARLRGLLLAGAGICLTLAFGSRLSLAPAVLAIAILTGWYLYSAAPVGKKKNAMKALFSLGIPLVIGLALLALYNFARFGSISQFGLRYQLAAHSQRNLPRGVFSSPRYLLPNLLLYLFMPPHCSPRFPYIFALGLQPMALRILHLPPTYQFEALVGVAFSQPFLLFAPLSARVVFRRLAKPDEFQWLALTLLTAAALGFAPVLFLGSSTMRWLMDAVPCLTILAAIGCWRFWDRPPRWAQWLIALAIVYEVAFGILLSLTAYYAHLSDTLPAIPGGFDWLTRR